MMATQGPLNPVVREFPTNRSSMTGLIEHLERFLGRIEYGWKDSDGTAWPFQVVKFSGGPVDGSRSYSTLGLSNSSLVEPSSGKIIRHELVFITRASFG